MRRLLDGDTDTDELLVPVRLSSPKRGSRQPWRGMLSPDFQGSRVDSLFLVLNDNISDS